MSDISFMERLKFETLLEMEQGYVLTFSSRTFQECIADATGLDIYAEKYNYASGSKANRLRAFVKEESNSLVSTLLEKLIELAVKKYRDDEIPSETKQLYQDCSKIVRRLKEESIVDNIEVLHPNTNDNDFKLLARSIMESIDKNEPEGALDRLHTFVVKFVRELCAIHAIKYDKSESLNAVFGKYVRFVTDNNLIDSAMSEKILKYSINIIEAFNDVRNNRSLAHDNTILNYDESILIFNNVTNSIKFIKALEKKAMTSANSSANDQPDGLPF